MKSCQGCRQLNATINQAMKDLPAGEHWHIAAIIAEQNVEIVRLRKALKEVTR